MRRAISGTWAIGVLVLVMLAVVAYLLVGGSSSQAGCPTSSASGTALTNQPVSLNSVSYVQLVVDDRVAVPDVSSLGCGFGIVGARVVRSPTNATSGGAAYLAWTVAFYITDQPFVNGSTPASLLLPNSIVVTESSQPSSTTSYQYAVGLLPTSSCQRTNATSACSSQASENIVQVRGTYVVVDPAVPSAAFEVTSESLAVTVAPGTSGKPSAVMNYDQMMAIAGTMIP